MPKKEPPKIAVYTLGQHGINRVKSPVHVLDGELLNATNATVRPVQGQLAIAKRDGMAVINGSEAAAGSLVNIINIPIGPVCNVVPNRSWKAGAWSPSLRKFAVVGSTGTGDRVITSEDGKTWTLGASSSNSFFRDICWSPSLGLFAAVADSSQVVMTSPDGVVWTTRTAATNSEWWGICWSPDLSLFVAVGTGVTMTSTNGINWTSRTPASAARFWRKVVWADSLGLFVKVAATSPVTSNVGTSPDGINWTLRDPGFTSIWHDIAWSPTLERLVAVGQPHVGASTVYVMYSDDGINWTDTDYPINFVGNAVAWSPELGIYFAALSSDRAALSKDGVNWQMVALGCQQENISDIVWSPELHKFVLVGDETFELIRP